eukprot:7558380-Alexandrium_andersonii.AAC.1
MPRKPRRYAGGRPSPRANPALRRKQCAPRTLRTRVPIRCTARMRSRPDLVSDVSCTGAQMDTNGT